MKFQLVSALLLGASAMAAPAPTKRQADLGVSDLLTGVCDKIGGTMLTQTVCQTVTGSDVSVAAAGDDGGLALVTVSGDGLLSGASITVPVANLESLMGQLGLVSPSTCNR